jgi:hypothetical protein
MEFVRSVKGGSKRDRIKKGNIRRKLETISLNQKVEKRKEYLQRMHGIRIYKEATAYKIYAKGI